MADNSNAHRAKFIIGAVGVVFSIFGYFLVDRDVEIRRNIASIAKAIQDLAIESSRANIRLDDYRRRIEIIEAFQKERTERISRLETLMEIQRNPQGVK